MPRLLCLAVALLPACFFDTSGRPVEPAAPAPDSHVRGDQAPDTAPTDTAPLDAAEPTDSSDVTSPDIRKDTAPIEAGDTMAWSDLALWPLPLAQWRFDEGSGSTAYDSAGSSHGKIVSASWTITGYKGSALTFNGSSSYVEVPSSSKLSLTGAISIVAWIKADAITNRQVIISKTASGNNTWLLEINPVDFKDGILNFFLNTEASAGGGANFGGTTPVLKGAWQHLACVYDGKNRYIYLNGNLDSSAPHGGAIHTNTQPIQIGKWGSSGRLFKGAIDEVAIFDAALSSTQVKQIFTNGL